MPILDMKAKRSPKAAIFLADSTTCAGYRKSLPKTAARSRTAHNQRRGMVWLASISKTKALSSSSDPALAAARWPTNSRRAESRSWCWRPANGNPQRNFSQVPGAAFLQLTWLDATHTKRQLGRGKELSHPACVALQDRRRNDGSLDGGHAALRAVGIARKEPLTAISPALR